jgi:hypothetical protein
MLSEKIKANPKKKAQRVNEKIRRGRKITNMASVIRLFQGREEEISTAGLKEKTLT